MKLTKRQLKRIIREEYSRLKRRGLIKESGYDYSKTYEPLDYEYVFTIIHEMYDDHYPDEIASHLADEVDPKHVQDALEEALEDQMHPKDPIVKILKMAVDYFGRGRFSR